MWGNLHRGFESLPLRHSREAFVARTVAGPGLPVAGPGRVPLDRGQPAGLTLLATAPIMVLAAVITALAWPAGTDVAMPGLDSSWQAALHLAAEPSLRQGVDVVFTYGPLGWLTVAHPVFGWTSVVALIATGGIYFGIVVTLFYQVRRLLPLWATALLALLVARTFIGLPPPEALQVLLFAWAIEALAGQIPLSSAAVIF